MSEQLFTLHVNAQDLAAIAAGLQELKAKVAMPLIQKLNLQLASQVAAATAVPPPAPEAVFADAEKRIAELSNKSPRPKPEGKSGVIQN